MNSRLRDYRLLWRAAVSHGNPFASVVVRFGLPFLVLLIAAALWISRGAGSALAWVWGVLCFFLLLTWTYRFVPGAVKLAAPAHAKLVPQVRRRLAELFCLVWFIGIVGLALPTYLEGAGTLMLLWCVGMSLGMALGAAGHPAGTPIIFAVFFAALAAGDIPPAAGAVLSHPASPVLALLLSAGLVAVVARLVFPEAGERHWRMVARRARMADAAVNPGFQAAAAKGMRSRRWYAATLRRHSASRDPRRLVLHALGNTHHVDDMVMGLGLVSAVVFALGTFIGWRVGDEVIGGIGWLFACCLLSVPFATTLRLAQLAPIHAGEQALVRLAPAMPSTAPALNRHFALALLRIGAIGWLLASLAALAVGALAGTQLDKLANLACVCCLMLPMVAAPLRNYAARGPFSPMAPIMLLLASIAASLDIGFAARSLFGSTVLPVAALASIVFAAIAVVRGLRVMEGAPFAFPAGRMA